MYGYVCIYIYIYIYIHVWYMYACVFTYKIQQLEREDRNISGYLIWCGSTRIYRQSLSPVITGDHEVLGIQISVDLGTTIMVDMAGAWCWLRLTSAEVRANPCAWQQRTDFKHCLQETGSYMIILDCLLQVAGAAHWCCQGDAVADMKNKCWEAATQLCSFADNADLCGSLHFGQVKSTHEYVALGGFQSHGGTPKSSNLDNFGIETHGFWDPPFQESST